MTFDAMAKPVAPLRLTSIVAIVLMFLATGASRGRALAPPAPIGSDTSWINIEAPVAATVRPITIEDILSIREVQEVAIAPDGRLVAFLLRQAFRACNCYRTALFVSPPGGAGPARKLLEEAQLLQIRWSPDNRFITFLSSRGGSMQVWRVQPDGTEPLQLFSHTPRRGQTLVEALGGTRTSVPIGVDQYEWSPDGSRIAFVSQGHADMTRTERAKNGGIVYDDESMWVFDLLRQHWASAPVELWIYDLRSSSEHLLWRAPEASASSKSTGVWGLAWAPAGDKIAVGYPAAISRSKGWMNHDIGLITTSSGSFEQLTTTDSVSEGLPTWSPDGTQLAYVSVSDWDRGVGALSVITLQSRRVRRYAEHISGVLVPWLTWDHAGNALLFEASVPGGEHLKRSGLYRVALVSGVVHRVNRVGDHISKCRDLVGGAVACVLQRPDLAPDPVLLNVASGQTLRLATVNPQMRELTLSPVRELRWFNSFGDPANGYLILPNGYVRGRRYPLVVVLYGFQGRFIASAEWLTSYPAQVFARDGFAVLLCNPSAGSMIRNKQRAKGTSLYGYGPLSSIEAGVRVVSEMGIADSNQVGIMGWSYGGYIAQFALAHSSRFRVGAIGNGGGWSLGAYWYFGSRAHRQFYEGVVGGPPYGATIRAWLRFFPASNAGRITAPLLMEFDADEAVAGLEMYTALRRYRKPVEFVIYPDESHVFSQPVHRLASMQRNLDWFSFWLLHRPGEALMDSGRADRWNNMRASLRDRAFSLP